MPEIQPSLNETVSTIKIFSLVTGLEKLLELIVEQSTFMLIGMEEIHSYQGRTESISWNKLRYGYQ